MLEVRDSPREGRGLFATRRIKPDRLLMCAPVLLIHPDERDSLEETIIGEYVYEWYEDGTVALPMGVSSFCNHDPEPNAYLYLVPDELEVELWSIRPIDKDEEITVDYRAAGDGDDPLWFEVRRG